MLSLISSQFCEVITVSWLRQLSAQVVRIMLDYTDHVSFCTKLKETLKEQKQWLEICHMQSKKYFSCFHKLQSSLIKPASIP